MSAKFLRLVLAFLVACLFISTVAAESHARREKFAERSQRKGFNPKLKKRNPEASPKYIKRATATTASSAAAASVPKATTPYVSIHYVLISLQHVTYCITFSALNRYVKLFEICRWGD